jgi:HD-GYP domain-containing protein (c-di-GMP phosphodiesterase class II)
MAKALSPPRTGELPRSTTSSSPGVTGRFASEDAEKALLEHYRSTFASSKDAYRTRLPSEMQQYQSPIPGKEKPPERASRQPDHHQPSVGQETMSGKSSLQQKGGYQADNRMPAYGTGSFPPTPEKRGAITPEKLPDSKPSASTSGKERLSPQSTFHEQPGQGIVGRSSTPETPRFQMKLSEKMSLDKESFLSHRSHGESSKKEALPASISGGETPHPGAKESVPHQSPGVRQAVHEEVTRHRREGEKGHAGEKQPLQGGTRGPEAKHGILNASPGASLPKPASQQPPSPMKTESDPDKEAVSLHQELEKGREKGSLRHPESELPAKGKEELTKPWESALKLLRKQPPPSSPENKTAGSAFLEHQDPQLPQPPRERTTLPSFMKTREEPPPELMQHPEPAAVMLKQKENPLQKLRDEVKQKLESPLTDLAREKPLADMAFKTEGIQGQAYARKKEESPPAEPHGGSGEKGADAASSKKHEVAAPLRERSFVPRKKTEKGIDESSSRAHIDSAMQTMRDTGEKAMGGLAAAFAGESGLPARHPGTGKFEPKKGDSAASGQFVDEVQRRERRFGEHQEEHGSSGERGDRHFGSGTRQMSRAPSGGQASLPHAATPGQVQREVIKQEMTERVRKDSIMLAETSRQEPIRLTTAAVQHASTSIESILKKSEKDIWTGEEMAAKLIALLMKSASSYTYEHSSRVIDLSVSLAREMGIGDDTQLKEIEDGAMFHDIGEVELDLKEAPPHVQARLSRYLGTADIQDFSFLHDIGKVKIPESILYKPTRLTDEEFEIIKQHPIIGEEILRPIASLRHALPVVRHHHEKWDGSGYPDGLEGKEIPLGARIVAITDSFDAMVSDRPYRKGMPVEQAVEELKKGAGTQFDPHMVEAFLKIIEREY